MGVVADLRKDGTCEKMLKMSDPQLRLYFTVKGDKFGVTSKQKMLETSDYSVF